VTARSTYVTLAAGPQQGPVAMAAYAGVLISNTAGPGTVVNSFASNMADSGFHIAGCPDCNAVFKHDTANHNVIGFSATDTGGRLLIEHSLFEHNGPGSTSPPRRTKAPRRQRTAPARRVPPDRCRSPPASAP